MSPATDATPGSSTPSANPSSSSTLARIALLLTAAWLLAGALFKLLVGTPGDLPPVLFALPLPKDAIYRLAIAAEFVIVALALLKPRIGWWLCAAAMVVFDVILTQLIASGAKSCGCFGGKIEMPPQLMLAIDTVLLVALLAGRPWRSLRWRGLDWPVTAIVALALASLPWLYDRSVDLLPVVPRKTSVAGQPVPENGAATRPAVDGGVANPTAQDPAAPNQAAAKPGLRGYLILDAPTWVGKRIEDTPLAQLLDVYAYDVNCTWVLWSWTCDHCAVHLAEMARTYDGATPLVLLRLRKPEDTDKNGVITTRPVGPLVLEAELPDTVDYVATTPIVLELKDGVVVSAIENPGH
jgi:hypothetical protein